MKFRNILPILMLTFFCSACKVHKIESLGDQKVVLEFLDDYILDSQIPFEETTVGGLSAIDYKDRIYYLICDDAKNPRYYTATLALTTKGIDSVCITRVTKVRDPSGTKLATPNTLDMEGILFWSETQELIIASEGNLKEAHAPSLFTIDPSGSIQSKFMLPANFSLGNRETNQPRHNGVFEGLAKAVDGSGLWVANELPLEQDGPEPNIHSGGTPTRITYYDYASKKATYQFTYPLSPMTKDPKGDFGINGVTALLQYDEYTFWIIERGFSAGYGTQGNTVRIYETDIRNATNTLDINNLTNQPYQPATKRLLFDFDSVREQLTHASIDNIEGMTLGPRLKNNKQSLILVSDNNFAAPEEQMNQFIILQF